MNDAFGLNSTFGDTASFVKARDMAAYVIQHPLEFEWTIQGLGMLRMYPDKDRHYRLHVWDSGSKYVGDSGTHTHPWDFISCTLSGTMRNTRYSWIPITPGETYVSNALHNRQLISCGANGCHHGDPELGLLRVSSYELYAPGMFYEQKAGELHSSDPDDGTVSVIRRTFHEDTEHAYVFYPADKPCESAAARPATLEEILKITKAALELWK